MKTFKQFISDIYESIEAQKGSKRTQLKLKDFDVERDIDKRAGTLGTYRKTSEILSDKLPQNSDVLDYGAGAGQGAQIMRKKLEGHNIETYEPQAEDWNPHYQNADDITKKYNAVVSHNVLNVLQPELRSKVTQHMLSLVKPEGYIVVNARKWKGDVQQSEGKGKNKPSEEESNALWVHDKKEDSYTYHRGFDGNELLDHFKSHDPEGNFEFKRVGDRIVGKRIK